MKVKQYAEYFLLRRQQAYVTSRTATSWYFPGGMIERNN